jgi:SAM-dependent methyltransferase
VLLMSNQTSDQIRETIRSGYAEIARTGSFVGVGSARMRDERGERTGCCNSGSCCGPSTLGVDELAGQIGYSADELAALPEGANMGLSCGNPAAIAALRPGETVVDLGSGGGFDVFLAGPKVGPVGRAIGVDMTAEMVARARANIAHYKKNTGLDNAEYYLGEIEHLPLPDKTADVVISNCVLNLSTDKPQVWREVFRVLKGGGRVAISDIALLRELPAEARRMAEAWVGCVAGAAPVEDIRRMLEAAGFDDIRLTPRPEYVKAMTSSSDPLYNELAGMLPAGVSPADCITSLDITARKPVGCC